MIFQNRILFKYKKNVKKNVKISSFYDIQNRVDLTSLDCYTIDPENCQDADDGFSIELKNNFIFLYIHIADPTNYFTPDSELFSDILSNGLTHYPSNSVPDHMFPNFIIENSSLMNGLKKAITIKIKFDYNYNLVEKDILFSLINCNNRFSYNQAAQTNIDIFNIGLAIAEYLKNNRENSHLSELIYAYPKIINNKYQLFIDDVNTIKFKNMIAEFAILANTIVAEYVYENSPENIFIRECNDALLHQLNYLSANELIYKIITNGIKAEYNNIANPHLLVGSTLYTHFTSPLRRASDCIVHFLLKSIYLNIPIPFSNNQLKLFAEKLNIKFKKEKKIQFDDNKYRILEACQNILNDNEPIIFFFNITGYTGLFINVMINRINQFPIKLSLSFRSKIEPTLLQNIEYTIVINQINLNKKFDNEILPDFGY